jgi:hypothetical protein
MDFNRDLGISSDERVYCTDQQNTKFDLSAESEGKRRCRVFVRHITGQDKP